MILIFFCNVHTRESKVNDRAESDGQDFYIAADIIRVSALLCVKLKTTLDSVSQFY